MPFLHRIDGIYFFFPEIPLPNEQARMDILKIHSAKITKHGDIGRWSIYLLSKIAWSFSPIKFTDLSRGFYSKRFLYYHFVGHCGAFCGLKAGFH